LLKDFSNPY